MQRTHRGRYGGLAAEEYPLADHRPSQVAALPLSWGSRLLQTTTDAEDRHNGTCRRSKPPVPRGSQVKARRILSTERLPFRASGPSTFAAVMHLDKRGAR